jgi:hypothetical protein
MKLISSLMMCLGLSACATDYASQLSAPNFGIRSLKYSEGTMDPTLLMNGSYAARQLNGSYAAVPLGAFCLTDYRCSPQAPQAPPGWNP